MTVSGEKTATRGKIVNSPGTETGGRRGPPLRRRKDALAPRAAPNPRPRAGGISGTLVAGAPLRSSMLGGGGLALITFPKRIKNSNPKAGK